MNNNNFRYSPLNDDNLTTNTNYIKNILIWLDEEAINSTLPNTQLTIDMFKSISTVDYKLYNNLELFLTEVENITKTMRVIIVISGSFAEKLLPKLSLSLLREISSIFIFCKDSTNYKYLQKKYRKVIDISTDEEFLKEAIQDELNPSTNFLVMDRYLNPLFSLKDDGQEFHIYKQYIEIVKYYPWSSDNREKMLNECIKHYRNNTAQRRKIEEFKYNYTPETAIQWYTRGSFLYLLVNKALRSLEMEQIIIFQPYIKDLCKQLERLHKENQSDRPLTVFRGHGNMTMEQFEIIKGNIGGLVSFNGFLSTTTDYNVAIIFSGSLSNQNKSVIFEIRTNYNLKNVVFADISQFSATKDEKEVLFSLCSIFRIDEIINDEKNQLSKVIMSAVDEDAEDIVEKNERKHYLSSIIQYCRKQYMIKIFATIFFMIISLSIILGINMKLKDQSRNSSNCFGSHCTNLSTTTDRQTTTVKSETSELIETPSPVPVMYSTKTISTTPEYATSNSTLPIGCVPVGWNYKGNLITSDHPYINLAVDNDLNVYVADVVYQSLDKWSPQGILLKRLYSGNFYTDSPLFFHSPTRSLYFCNFWKNKSSIFKITDENPIPIIVIENMISELGKKLGLFNCAGLYVNLHGDIFMFDAPFNVLRKWTVNSSSAIVVANLYKTNNSVQNIDTRLSGFAIDETNNIIYLSVRDFYSSYYSRILKCINGSKLGITIIDGSPIEMFPSTKAVDIDAYSIAIDKSGFIVIGESDKITLWSSDGKFNGIVMDKYQFSQSDTMEKIYPHTIVFDRLGNLYTYVTPGRIIRFNRTSSTCKNSVVRSILNK